MKNNKNNKIILFISITVLLISLITFGFIWNYNKGKEIIDFDFINQYDDKTQTFINQTYVIYNNSYAFSHSKDSSNEVASLFGEKFNDPIEQIKQFDQLKINIPDSLSQKYNEVTKNPKVYTTKVKADWRNLSNPYPNGDFLSTNSISTEEKGLEFFQKNYIDFSHNKTSLYSEQSVDIKALNYSFRNHYSLYSPNIGEYPVLNLGKELTITMTDTSQTIVWSNFTENAYLNNQFDIDEIDSGSTFYPVNFTKFSEEVKSRNTRLYQAGYLGIPLSEESNIGLYGLNTESAITIDSISLEYLYMNENQTLVPLIRLDGYAEGKLGKVRVSFWNWFIKY